VKAAEASGCIKPLGA